MNVIYTDKTDVLYIRLNDGRQDVINKRISDNLVLDMGENEKVIGIEILNASKNVNIERLLPWDVSQKYQKGSRENKEMDVNDFYKNYLGITTPYTHQIKIWEIIEEGKYPILLKAPTGSGKTEAVIAPFLAQFIQNKIWRLC